jgi:hypothetical protein
VVLFHNKILHRGHGSETSVHTHALARLGAGGAATAGHDVHASQTQACTRAHQVLPGTATAPLRHRAEQRSQGTRLHTGVCTALLAGIGAALAR